MPGERPRPGRQPAPVWTGFAVERRRRAGHPTRGAAAGWRRRAHSRPEPRRKARASLLRSCEEFRLHAGFRARPRIALWRGVHSKGRFRPCAVSPDRAGARPVGVAVDTGKLLVALLDHDSFPRLARSFTTA